MSRTVTAMFDSRSEAEEAKTRLTASRIDADNVRIIDQNDSGSFGAGSDSSFSGSSMSSTNSTTGASHEGQGFWASLKDLFLPDDDRAAYGEGISRGGFLLSASVDEDEADEAIRILDESNSVDFDQREQEWRSSGWAGYSGGGGDATMGATGVGLGASGLGSMDRGDDRLDATDTRSDAVSEERIPIVEEQLRVGKREVERGGARVRSYVRETPVHEQVTLREEHVSVERVPVDRTLRAGEVDTADMLQDRTIEMRETSEEAVIDKQAVVKEELVVRKTAEERVEQIDDTVRRTEVDVEEGLREGADRPALGGFGNRDSDRLSTDSSAERTDFERTDRDKSL